MNEGVSVRGWEIFFVEIDRFIQVSERHLESANDRVHRLCSGKIGHTISEYQYYQRAPIK